MQDATSFPDNLTDCHRLITQLHEQREQLAKRLSTQEAQLEEHARAVVDLDSARQTLSRENEELKQKIQLLLNRIYGRRSERVVDARQLLLDFGGDTQALHDALAETAAEAEATLDELQTKRKAKRKPRPVGSNQKFPEHLPRYEKIIDLPDEEKSGKTFIGYDEVEQLELQLDFCNFRLIPIW